MSSDSVAARVRETVLASRNRFWRPEEFSDYSSSAVARSLSRLAENGELRRIHRGLYWRGTLTPFGMAPPPASNLARALAPSRGSGPAGLSAAFLLGLTTQVPRREVIAVIARAPGSTDTLRFVSRAAATGRRSAVLNPVEVALLEVLRDWNVLVESPADEAKSRIAGLMRSGDIRPDRVARASLSEPASVRERLRALLGDVGKAELAAKIPPARGRRLALAG